MNRKPIVLAFSGGLDTSFCVPWLTDQGFDVTTLFVDTGGVGPEERDYIAARASSLGAVEHVTADVSEPLWQEVIVPLLWSGQWYQGQYPLLCSDRYLIVKKAVELCDQLGATSIAHGCTGMGNDQVRFDLTIRALSDLEIVAPIREIQKQHTQVREYEIGYLREKGFDVRDKSSRYSINENMLGTTISGEEIDQWQAPDPSVWQWTANAEDWPKQPLSLDIKFEKGVPVEVSGFDGSQAGILQYLNQTLGAYGVGRGIYTGDTTIGLKGRIAFEAPGIVALCEAHRALEETTLTRHQNSFKPMLGTKWVELVYQGFFYEPLKKDIEAYLAQSQQSVSGTVTLTTEGGQVLASAISSSHILKNDQATYAQTADWSATEAEGFIKLIGQSSALWKKVNPL